MIDKLNGCIFWLKMIANQKNIILFGIKSAKINKNEFDSEPAYTKKFLKTKLKPHGDEVTDFYDNKIPKVSKNPFSLDSALNKNENYNLQVFLKECKDNEEKVNRHILMIIWAIFCLLISLIFLMKNRLKKWV